MKIRISEIRFLILLCAVFFSFATVSAQQKPEYTQYILNQYILNPALSGIENYTDIKLSHRHEWVGISDAPVTTYLTVQGPIGKQDNRTTSTTVLPNLNGENIRGKEYWDEYEAPPAHQGVGVQFINDNTGPFNDFSFFATYAYHMPLNAKTSLSAGIGLGVTKLTLNTDKLFFGPAYPSDPSIYIYDNSVIGKTRFDANAGLWLYSAKYFVGVSALQLVPQQIDFSDSGTTVTKGKGKMIAHIFATAGYRLQLNDDVSLLPSIMVKDISPLPIQLDLNAKLEYEDLVWVGATYRGNYGFAGMAGFNVANKFTISYSYDYTTTQLNTVSSGTHEIIIGFAIGNSYSTDNSPGNLW